MDCGNEGKYRKHISSFPEFSEIFLFLQIFGPLMKLSAVTLKALEDFFIDDTLLLSDEVATIQWRLLRWAGKNGGKEEWQRMAVKFGRRLGLVPALVEYEDVDVHTRMKIFQRLCGEQFECNVILRKNLSWDERTHRSTSALGVDRDGRRYWLLQDSSFDVHLYSDHAYADPPTNKSTETWELLASCQNDLADHISWLDSRSSQLCRSATPTQSHDTAMQSLEGSDSSANRKDSKSSKNARKSSREKVKQSEEKVVVGCLKCHKDVNYKKMLLCDTCDRECHTYCQYPVLWTVPKGKWQCPICKEQQLLKALQQTYLTLSQAKAQREQLMERKQRSVARLQRSGVLLQNILEDGEEEGRSRRRNRKKINYAELNDIYLPPLSPDRYGGRESRKAKKSSRSMFDYVQDDYLAPRVRNSNRRGLRGPSPQLEVLKEEEEAHKEVGYYGEGNARTGASEDPREDDALVHESLGGCDVGDFGRTENIGSEISNEVKSILGKRSHDSRSPETTCAGDASRYPPSPSPLSSSLSPTGGSVMSNGSPSTSRIPREEDKCGSVEVLKHSVKQEGDVMQQPWKQSEVNQQLPQDSVHGPLAFAPASDSGSVPVFGESSSQPHLCPAAGSDDDDDDRD